MTLSESQGQFTEMIADLIKYGASIGYRMRLRDVLRSTDKLKCPSCQVKHSYQELLVFNKRSKTLNSKHPDGLAADFEIDRLDGTAMDTPDYERLGSFWENAGGTWGGRWKMKDLGHFEYTAKELALGATV